MTVTFPSTKRPYTLILNDHLVGYFENLDRAKDMLLAEITARALETKTVRYKIYREERNGPIELVEEN